MTDTAPPDRTATAGRPPADRTPIAGKSPTSRSSITNNALSRWSGSTAEGRRTRDLFRAYLRAVGKPADEIKVALVVAAAEMTVIAERTRLDHLAGKGTKVNDVVRAESSAARALRRIGLNNEGKAAKPTRLSQKDIAARYTGGATSPPSEAAK